MNVRAQIKGVIPAVATPLTADGTFHVDNFVRHIKMLEDEGCDGIVILGTTGEGPSMGFEERKLIISAAIDVAGDMLTIAGTGSASLVDTIALTRHAFEVGADAVLVIPPFYFKNPQHAGLAAYYRRILNEAVPPGGQLLLYHIPQVTQVPITFELLDNLYEAAPDKVAGVKDSSGDLKHLQALCKRFPALQIFAGNDRHLLEGLGFGAAGCITAGANVLAPLNVVVFNAFKETHPDAATLQKKLTAGRAVLEQYMPFPPTIKYLLAQRYATADWHLRPPLVPLQAADQTSLLEAMKEAGISQWLTWLDKIE